METEDDDVGCPMFAKRTMRELKMVRNCLLKTPSINIVSDGKNEVD